MSEIKSEGSGDHACFRSGVAARLAGLAVETLRVWERRYAVSETHRSEHGQRLYSAAQVRRLGLLKQLVDQGNPIGTIAALPVEQLENSILDNELVALTPHTITDHDAMRQELEGVVDCGVLEVVFGSHTISMEQLASFGTLF